jgi:3'(2'), 5'-bisphosphate nucleotidase
LKLETRNSELETAISAAEQACKEIMAVYDSGDFQAEAKGDKSPLTLADKMAHRKIVEVLQKTGLPVLSEEGKNIPFEERKNWEYFWLVDPLDGTKEFIKRNGEFTVNIALINNGIPVMGVVSIPVKAETYYASRGEGVFLKKNGSVNQLEKRKRVDLSASGLRVVGSRSHMSPETDSFIKSLSDPSFVSAGSSLKFLLLANGQADVYPRFAPTMEWDTAAAHAIVNEAGLKVLQSGTDRELTYNKPDLLNPHFLVC